MAEVFVVTSGEYSDYSVECVFEREEDAITYVRLANLADVRRTHDLYHEAVSTSAFVIRERENHAESFENCAECQRDLAQGGERYGGYRVERFAFHPAGEVPHGEHNQENERP